MDDSRHFSEDEDTPGPPPTPARRRPSPPPQLSSYALAALQEFYAEQKQHHSDLRGDDKHNIRIIEENWRLSQFWYSPEMALRLAEDAVAAAG